MYLLKISNYSLRQKLCLSFVSAFYVLFKKFQNFRAQRNIFVNTTRSDLKGFAENIL